MGANVTKPSDGHGSNKILSVRLPANIGRQIRREKFETGLSIERIVAERLSISFDACPKIEVIDEDVDGHVTVN